LQVESYGPADAPALILTHGWPVNSAEWYYARRELAGPFRVVVWDLPGVGRSSGPANRDYSIEKMAGDLEAVLGVAGPQPAVLVGHSLGGVIVQMFCRLYPQHLGPRVAGIVLAHTTYTNPLATASGARLWLALQRPVLVPLFRGMIVLWPLSWLLHWLSYLSGLGHLLARPSTFAGRQTRGQLDYFVWLNTLNSPAVIGRGALASLAFEGREHLPAIDLPALVITAQEDRVTRIEAAQEMQRRLPQAELVSLSPAGHMGPWERHEAFAQAVAKFAQRHLAELPSQPGIR
jgi:pimeloyl-ACP methyl ester carboxylesterase